MRSLEFTKAADVIANFTLGVRPGEDVLVVRDTRSGEFPGVDALMEAVVSAVHAKGAEPQIISYVSRAVAGMEPPKIVADAMKSADAVVIMSTLSILQTMATTEALKSGTRVVMLPPARYLLNSPDLLYRLMPTDLKEEEERLKLAEKVAAVFRRGRQIRVTSSRGTDVTMRIGQLAVLHNPTTARESGQTTIVPGGQILAGVTQGSAEGRFVVDASASPMYRPLKSPIECVVEGAGLWRFAARAMPTNIAPFLRVLMTPRSMRLQRLGLGSILGRGCRVFRSRTNGSSGRPGLLWARMFISVAP